VFFTLGPNDCYMMSKLTALNSPANAITNGLCGREQSPPPHNGQA